MVGWCETWGHLMTHGIVPTLTILGCGFNASPPSQIFRIKAVTADTPLSPLQIVTRSARDLGLWTTVTRRHLKSSHSHRGLSPRHMVVASTWFKIWSVELLKKYAGMFGFPALSREVIVTFSQAKHVDGIWFLAIHAFFACPGSVRRMASRYLPSTQLRVASHQIKVKWWYMIGGYPLVNKHRPWKSPISNGN